MLGVANPYGRLETKHHPSSFSVAMQQAGVARLGTCSKFQGRVVVYS